MSQIKDSDQRLRSKTQIRDSDQEPVLVRLLLMLPQSISSLPSWQFRTPLQCCSIGMHSLSPDAQWKNAEFDSSSSNGQFVKQFFSSELWG